MSAPEFDIYERQAQVCKAFANAIRIHILDLLGKKERSATELQQTLGISKANLSQHLGILRTTGAVVTHRKGKQVFCVLAFPEVKRACSLMRQVLQRVRSR